MNDEYNSNSTYYTVGALSPEIALLVATKGIGTAVKKGIKTTGKVIKIVSKPPKKLNGGKTIEGFDDKILKGVGGRSSGTDGYTPPPGGGGTTSTLTVNGKTINIGYGGRHLDGTNLTVSDVNAAIAKNLVNKTLTSGFNEFSININGTNLTYRAFQLGPNKINIGTYFIPK